jgi:AcrR family transcriptional regulator
VIEGRRRQIDDAASALFRQRGYAATSVRDIARSLDMQGASLYAHVASKEDVLWSIVDRTASAFERAASAALEIGGPARERLAAFVRAHVLVVTGDPQAATVFVHEWRNLSGGRRDAILERRDRYEARLTALLREGMATGELAAADPRTAAAFVLAALNGIAAWYRPDGRLAPFEIAEEYAELCVRALTEAAR